VGPRAGLDFAKKRKVLLLLGFELIVSRLARSSSLYRLSYPGYWYRVKQVYLSDRI
jgi:hypothetical protein